jgi:esterase
VAERCGCLSDLQYALIHGRKLGYRVAGDLGSPTILLLHALASQSMSWNETAQALAGQGFRVIAPDLPGHGGSARMDDYSLGRLEQVLIDLLDALQVAQCDLVGHSLGGHLALRIAARIPHRVRRIVLEAVPVPPRDEADLAMMQAASRQAWWWRGLRLLGTGRVLRLALLRQFDFRATRPILCGLRLPMPEWWSSLRAIEARCLLVIGEGDNMVTLRASLLAEQLAHSRIEVIGHGHHIHRNHAQTFLVAMLSFLMESPHSTNHSPTYEGSVAV